MPPQRGGERVLTLGDLLRQSRTRLGLTQEELALAADGSISVDTIANVERGRTRPYRHTLKSLLTALQPSEPEQVAVWDAWRRMTRERAVESVPTTDRLAPLTPLIGREREVDQLRDLLSDGARLVTLTGPGGVGKTRLALAAADAVLDQIAHGAVVVDLAPTRDPRLVLAAIAQALGLPDTSDQPYRDRLIAHLRDAHRLLVLDNVEHVVEAAPELAEVLTACPHVKALATSRVALKVRGEQEVPVAPLTLPAAGDLADLEALAAVPAVALFVERARAVAPTFELTPDNAATVAAICTRLDGLPLALELAAAWLRLLSPAALLTRLERALNVLVDGPRDLPPRQRTLRATIEWSYSRLSEPQQRLLRRVSVFEGGCTLEAAEAVGDDSTVFTEFAALVDANLLRVGDTGDGEPRFSALETIREYAAEQLAASGEATSVQRRHAEWCLTLAETAEQHMRTGSRPRWLHQLTTEHDNLRAAMAWSLATPGQLETGLRLAGALVYFWYFRGFHTEGRRWLAEFLRHPDVANYPRLRAQALWGAGKLAWTQGDSVQGRALLEEGAALFESVHDDRGVAWCMANLGMALVLLGEPALAAAAYERGIAKCQLPDDAWVLAQLKNHSGQALWLMGDHTLGRVRLAEGRSGYAALSDSWGVAVATFLEAELDEQLGDDVAASAAYSRCVDMMRGIDDMFGLAWCTLRHGYLYLRSGDLDAAREKLRVSLEGARYLGHTTFVLGALAGCAALASFDGQDQAAIRLAARSAPLLDTPPGVGGPTNSAARISCRPALDALRARVPREVLLAETAMGESMSIEEAITLGRRVVQASVAV